MQKIHAQNQVTAALPRLQNPAHLS